MQDRMSRNEDPNDYVVHDPLLEKGKEKFNRMIAKQKRREREWAGSSLTWPYMCQHGCVNIQSWLVFKASTSLCCWESKLALIGTQEKNVAWRSLANMVGKYIDIGEWDVGLLMKGPTLNCSYFWSNVKRCIV